MGVLPAGEYRTTSFDPTLTFTLPEGWSQYFSDDSDEVALGGPSVDMNMTRPARVVDPERGPIDAPADLVDWFVKHPTLDTTEPQAIQVAGIASTTFDLKPPTSEVDIFAYETGNMRVPQGAAVHIVVVPMEGPDLVLYIGPPSGASGTLEDAISATQPIVDSLAIAP